ncbi:DUF6271 family protein [Exilibacterium tricleocarpae]|nr:DUF6271 family protein [Exilibacterium tricleocarpae]
MALPTNRACANAITDLYREAEYAVRHFPVAASVLIVDTSTDSALAANRAAVNKLPRTDGISVAHLDNNTQVSLLLQITTEPSLVRQLLPETCSYGAATNRLFLFANWLGCQSVHRRDSDSRYQRCDQDAVYPIAAELPHIFCDKLESSWMLEQPPPARALEPNWIVGGSFIGPPSVDLSGLKQASRSILAKLLKLTVPDGIEIPGDVLLRRFDSVAEPHLVDEFTLQDHAKFRVDLCNIAFRDIQQHLPVPNITDTIGSDYFSLELLRRAGRVPVMHNRHIVNQYLDNRQAEQSQPIYQRRLVNYVLYMCLFNWLAKAATSVFTDAHEIRLQPLRDRIGAAYDETRAQVENHLDQMTAWHLTLPGMYREMGRTLRTRRNPILTWYKEEVKQFEALLGAWPTLMLRARELGSAMAVDPMDRYA